MKLARPVPFVLIFLWLMAAGGCVPKEHIQENVCHLVLEEGKGFTVKDPARTVKAGSDVTYEIALEEGYQLLGVDYDGGYETDYDSDGNSASVVLHNIKYSETICLQVERGKYDICYHANGGTPLEGKKEMVRLFYRGTHLRINTSVGTELFVREGYTQIGWNTEADGSGIRIGLGSRVEWTEGLALFAQWIPWTEGSCFSYEEEGGFAVITGYDGEEEILCVPASLYGIPVRSVAENAFAGAKCKTVVLPPGLYEMEKWAFRGSSLEELYFYDDIQRISDYAFSECGSFSTLHINAVEPPVYCGNYFATFSDKYDRLLSLKDKKKIVLFSGSSARFGYDSAVLEQAFSEYRVINMGVFAYSPALPQLELILNCMGEGDILIDSPEFDAANRQFCSQKELDYAVFAMMEENYDAFAGLDIREFTQVFTAFTAYQTARRDMEGKSYEVSPSDFDEDGNPVEEASYNEYGDYVLYRPNSAEEKPVYGLEVNYTVNAFPKETYIQSINNIFQKFLDREVKVYFTYSPRNRYALSEESTREERAGLHQYLKENLVVPVISEIEDSLYSGVYLYGTDNHLSTEGVKLRTEKIIEEIRVQMQKEEAVS